MKALNGGLTQRNRATDSALAAKNANTNPNSDHASRRRNDFFCATLARA
jgi:hypothetical protein